MVKKKNKFAASSDAAIGRKKQMSTISSYLPQQNNNNNNNKNSSLSSTMIKGSDDSGNFYASMDELMDVQQQHREEWYAANQEWWQAGGYGGRTDDEAMIGDESGCQDGEEGLDFLDRFLSYDSSPSSPSPSSSSSYFGSTSSRRGGHCGGGGGGSSNNNLRAIDAGAGVGRVTKLVLLKRFDEVRLVEGDEQISKRSRAYLGRKRSERCNFTCAKLQDLHGDVVADWDGLVDLIWVQWTLQYLTDVDAENTLRTLAKGLVPTTGILIVKENRPYGGARRDRFQMETPGCSGRYDIVRTDPQFRFIFQRAGLRVEMTEEGAETTTYAVRAAC